MAYSERFDNETLVWPSLLAELGSNFGYELQRGLVHRVNESSKILILCKRRLEVRVLEIFNDNCSYAQKRSMQGECVSFALSEQAPAFGAREETRPMFCNYAMNAKGNGKVLYTLFPGKHCISGQKGECMDFIFAV